MYVKALFENSKNEIMLCFGCGHQSHKKCCYKRKLKKEEIINGIEFAEECMICHQKEIENEDEDKTEKEKEFELNDIKDLEGKENEVKHCIQQKSGSQKREVRVQPNSISCGIDPARQGHQKDAHQDLRQLAERRQLDPCPDHVTFGNGQDHRVQRIAVLSAEHGYVEYAQRRIEENQMIGIGRDQHHG